MNEIAKIVKIESTDICRACLSVNDNFRSIFQEEIIDNDCLIISSMISAITNIEINSNESLPKQICESCVNELIHLYKFRKQCIDADVFLKSKSVQNDQSFELVFIGNKTILKNTSELLNNLCGNEIKSESEFDDVHSTLKELKTIEIDESCELCNLKFKTNIEYSNHLKSHEQNNSTKCKKCELFCLCPTIIDNHIQFNCKVCLQVFKHKSSLKTHMEIHSETISYACNLCDEKFSRKRRYNEHMRLHAANKIYKCETCGKISVNASDHALHIKTHDHVNKFRCEFCFKAFNRKQNLNEHLKIHETDPLNNDDQQNSNLEEFEPTCTLFESNETIDNLIQFNCEVCLQVFKHKSSLKNHMEIHSETISYACNLCDEKFSRKRRYNEHMRLHAANKIYKCETCGKISANASDHALHIKIHDHVNKFRCEFCFKAFNRKNNLNEHLKIHETNSLNNEDQQKSNLEEFEPTCTLIESNEIIDNLIQFNCEVCLQVFKHKSSLKNHMQIHSETISYACNLCDEKFKRKRGYNEHMRLHAANASEHALQIKTNNYENRFRCEICFKAFQRKIFLNEHLKIHETDSLCNEDQQISNLDENKIPQPILNENEPQTANYLSKSSDFKFNCKVCSKKFKHARSLKHHTILRHSTKLNTNHVKSHEPNNSIKCKKCKLFCLCPTIIDNHIQFNCKICFQVFKHKSSLKTHMEIHSEAISYSCNLCKETFKRKRRYNEHIRLHDPNNVHKCETCGKVLTNALKYTLHIQSHNNEKKFRCEICFQAFEKLNLLNEHIKTHETDSLYDEDQQKAYLDENKRLSQLPLPNLEEFIKGRSLNEAEIEETLTYIKQPIISKFDGVLYRKFKTVRDKNFPPFKHECPICYKLVSKELSIHYEIHNTENKYLCYICGDKFTSRVKQKQHMCTKHYEKYKCDLCSKTFPHPYQLQMHLYTHTGEKPFMCDLCDARFSQKSTIKVHKRLVHSDVRPFTCDICSATFKLKSKLTSHLKCHSNERPYKCNFCNKAFTRLDYWRTHCEIHTGEKTYECDICNKTFTVYKYFKTHQRSHKKESVENI